jgi:gamma-glutamyl-gamma-aminobutyrate hydrolase PuuD
MADKADNRTESRPRIGLNMTLTQMGDELRQKALCHLAYIDAVAAAGGVPVLIPPYPDLSMLDEALAGLDGFCFIGGPDYDPAVYGGHEQEAKDLMHPRRNHFDLDLARRILDHDQRPALGICGGHQLFSIARGGALVQDIASEWKSGKQPLRHSSDERIGTDQADNRFRHAIKLAPGSRIARVIGAQSVSANSFHHQAIDPQRIGKGLIATGWSEDGVIEAVEVPGERFVIGVQWHPERQADEKVHASIFSALVNAAKS